MQLQMKVEPTEWQGRTMYRAYYQKANGRWARYGKYEAGSASQLVAICERLRGTANLVWINYTPPSGYDIKAGDRFTYGGNTYTATADATGEFNAYIEAISEATGQPTTVVIAHGNNPTMEGPAK